MSTDWLIGLVSVKLRNLCRNAFPGGHTWESESGAFDDAFP